jgi:hypothetical protein
VVITLVGLVTLVVLGVDTAALTTGSLIATDVGLLVVVLVVVTAVTIGATVTVGVASMFLAAYAVA